MTYTSAVDVVLLLCYDYVTKVMCSSVTLSFNVFFCLIQKPHPVRLGVRLELGRLLSYYWTRVLFTLLALWRGIGGEAFILLHRFV